MNILTIFITGLFAGGITCLAVQGGLLASSIASSHSKSENEEEVDKITNHLLPVFSFLITRLLAYIVLGFFLGFLGSFFELSLKMRVVLQFAAAVFMIGTALNLLELHPIFRYFVIQPPRFLTKLVKKQSRSQNIFGPAILGVFTVLIPCGATQAMMAYSISTLLPIQGAITMGVFILGTSPLFLLLGLLTDKMKSFGQNFNKAVALAIILIALYNASGALALSGSELSFENLFTKKVVGKTQVVKKVNQATIYFTKSGYVTKPEVINVNGGTILKLNLVNETGTGCVQAFTIPKFDLQKTVPVGKTEEIEIQIPPMSGKIPFMCGMGMYKGVINVI